MNRPRFKKKSSYYDDYIDSKSYSLEEYVELNHDDYGLDFISNNLGTIIDNTRAFDGKNTADIVRSAFKIKIKFKFKWNKCTRLGVCLVITFGNAGGNPELTESTAFIINDKLVVIPHSSNNGMLSDGYIFVDQIDIGNDEADLLGVSYGSKIKAGIYKSILPTINYPYGVHILDIIN